MLVTVAPVRTSTPKAISCRRAFSESSGTYAVSTRSDPSSRMMCACFRIDPPKILGQSVMRDFAQRAGQLDASRPSADDDEGQPGTALGRVRLALGHFKGRQHPAADFQRIADTLQSRRQGAHSSWPKYECRAPVATIR